jgi:hypothetical protein
VRVGVVLSWRYMSCSGGRGGASTTALLIKRAHVVSQGVLRQKCRIQEDLSSHRVHHAVSRGAHRSSVQSVERASLSYRGSSPTATSSLSLSTRTCRVASSLCVNLKLCLECVAWPPATCSQRAESLGCDLGPSEPESLSSAASAARACESETKHLHEGYSTYRYRYRYSPPRWRP